MPQTDLLPYIPYCGPPPRPDTLWTAWNGDPLLLSAFALAALAGAWGLRRAGRRQRFCFAAAWLVLFITLVSPLCNLTSALFSARVGQHLLMLQLAAPLLVFSGLWGLRPHRDQTPWAPEWAWGLHGLLLWVWHLPVPYAAALEWDAVLWLMHGSLFVTAVAAWRTLLLTDVGLRGRAVLAAFGTSLHMGLLGAVLAFARQPLFEYHLTTTQAWGLSPLADQQLGATFMWVLGCAVYSLAGVGVLARMLNSYGRTAGS